MDTIRLARPRDNVVLMVRQQDGSLAPAALPDSDVEGEAGTLELAVPDGMLVAEHKLGAPGDPWSSLGPNTNVYSVATNSTTVIPAYYKRTNIELSLDTAVTTVVVYGLFNPGSGSGQTGTPSATNFHFVLFSNQPPFTTQYTGPIGLVASANTHVGVVEN